MAFDKILTDVPLLDEIVYYVKTMAFNTVLKDEDEADSYETIESDMNANLYIKCIEGTAQFELFDYTREFLLTTSIPESLIDECVRNKENIPLIKRDEVTKLRIQKYIDEYNELNNYYRKLNGCPDIGEEPLYVEKSALPNLIVMDCSVPLHKMPDSDIENLESLGIIKAFQEQFPEKYYLKHLGAKRVNIYDARTAVRFAALYVPVIPAADVYNRYKARLEVNRVYTLKTVYSEAYKMTSDFYDKFIILFIVLQTMVDMIVQLPEYIIRRDIFDIRTVQYFLEGFGVEFYEEIPLVYQVAMVKNLNKLIKWHSTTKCMVDICSLFGYDDIEIFKYYILRDRKVDITGKYIHQTKQVVDKNNPENTIATEDLPTEYDLKFLKCPITSEYDEYIRDPNNIYKYDDIVSGDKYWDGELDHEQVKNAIIEHEFNVLRTKYISIDTIQEMTELAIQMPYFFNILFDNKKLEELLLVSVPYISGTGRFKLTDLISFLWSISYEYNGIKDHIMDSTAKLLYIKGFNFNADMAALSEYIASKKYTAKDLGIDGFIIPTTSILSFTQLMNIFATNVDIMKHVIHEITHADNKDIYDIYYKIYDTLCIQKYSDEFFRLPDGSLASNYKEYLSTRDITLYNAICAIENINDLVSKQTIISEYISSIIYALSEFIDSDKYKFLWFNIPTVSGEAIKKYMTKVINFFKSYKIEILSINTIYLFNDRLENMITMIDKVFIDITKTKGDFAEVIEQIRNNVSLTEKDKYKLIEKIYIDITRMVQKLYHQYGSNITEGIYNALITMVWKDVIDTLDEKETLYFSNFNKSLYMSCKSMDYFVDASISKKEKSTIIEKIYIVITNMLKKNLNYKYDIDINQYITSEITAISNLNIHETVSIVKTTTP